MTCEMERGGGRDQERTRRNRDIGGGGTETEREKEKVLFENFLVHLDLNITSVIHEELQSFFIQHFLFWFR